MQTIKRWWLDLTIRYRIMIVKRKVRQVGCFVKFITQVVYFVRTALSLLLFLVAGALVVLGQLIGVDDEH